MLSAGAWRALTGLLPEAAAFAAREFIIGALAHAPRRVGVPLRAPFESLWPARRGNYRVRYRIDEDGRRIEALDIDHRCDAYRGGPDRPSHATCPMARQPHRAINVIRDLVEETSDSAARK